jgi:hypothetical protein
LCSEEMRKIRRADVSGARGRFVPDIRKQAKTLDCMKSASRRHIPPAAEV